MKSFARDRDVREILERIPSVRPDSQRRWGRMSAHQMICHLNDAFRMATGEKPVAGAPRFRDRTVSKWMALHLPLPWPAGIPTVPEIDQEIGGTNPGDFDGDRAELVRRVREIASRRGSVAWPPHPIFGAMSERQWLRWAYLHVDHHLRQFGV